MTESPMEPSAKARAATPQNSAARDTTAGGTGKQPSRGAQSVAGGLALIFSLMTFSATAYLWYVLKERQGLLKGDVVGRVEQIDKAQAQARNNIAALEEEFANMRDTQDTLRAATEKLSTDFGRARNDWMLAEAEQLMFIANHRLQLAQDTRLALAALRAADRQLQQIANPSLIPIRRQLAQEMAQLEAANKVDYDGLALKLGSIAGRIDQLPLAIQTDFTRDTEAPRTTATDRNAWWQFGHEVWQDILSLIRIRNDADVRQPLLPPEQQYFLRENLRLVLTSAQLALLQRNDATFQQNLKLARTWLQNYFDAHSPAVAGAANELAQMAKTPLKLQPPDISGSLAALHKLVGKPRTQ